MIRNRINRLESRLSALKCRDCGRPLDAAADDTVPTFVQEIVLDGTPEPSEPPAADWTNATPEELAELHALQTTILERNAGKPLERCRGCNRPMRFESELAVLSDDELRSMDALLNRVAARQSLRNGSPI